MTSAPSLIAVKATRSQKRVVTTLRLSETESGAASLVAHLGQKATLSSDVKTADPYP